MVQTFAELKEALWTAGKDYHDNDEAQIYSLCYDCVVATMVENKIMQPPALVHSPQTEESNIQADRHTSPTKSAK